MGNDTEKKLYWSIEKLSFWDKNPRAIKNEDFDRLKKQLKEKGQWKPLIINESGVVLGGNMRLKAMHDLGIKEVWVSVVNANNTKDMLEYALEDNEMMGFYQDQQLAELLSEVPDFKFDEFKVDLSSHVSLRELITRFGPDLEDREQDQDITDKDLETYQQGNIKQIVLYFMSNEFDGVFARLQEVIKDFNLQNNSEAVVKLLDFYEKNRNNS